MSKPFQMRLPGDLLDAVDEVAAALPDRQERSVAIRTLLREALAARADARLLVGSRSATKERK